MIKAGHLPPAFYTGVNHLIGVFKKKKKSFKGIL